MVNLRIWARRLLTQTICHRACKWQARGAAEVPRCGSPPLQHNLQEGPCEPLRGSVIAWMTPARMGRLRRIPECLQLFAIVCIGNDGQTLVESLCVSEDNIKFCSCSMIGHIISHGEMMTLQWIEVKVQMPQQPPLVHTVKVVAQPDTLADSCP